MSTDARGAREYVADDGFHEIQLSGKQLVFLFMATTVVSIVIFLCGVLVGRGGRPEPSALEAIGTPVTDAGAPAGATPEATPAAPDVTATPSADPGAGAPAAVSADEQSYINALTDESRQATIETPPSDGEAPPGVATSAPEPVAKTPAPVATPPPVVGAAKPVPPPAAQPAAAAAPATTPATRSGWTIQVSAFRDRGQADQFAAQLKAKRYDAYVAAPDASSPLFRVRVGTFNERREATPVADRLKKDKFKPWVTR